MSTKEIIQNIKRLPFSERLLIIEKTIKTLHEPMDDKLDAAAKALLLDYKQDKDLTALITLDFDKFYEAR